MKRSTVATLRAQLVDRDLVLLGYVEQFRLLTSRQLQRLVFDPSSPTPVAAARACNRTLTRLRDLGLVTALQRRIGGVRAGSAGFVYYLGPAGERVLAALDPDVRRGRRNYREPSRHFTDHTLAVAELAVQTIEAGRSGAIEVLALEAEPATWRQSLSPHGTVQWLKPDLRVVTATAEDELHHFVEVDLASEHLPVVLRQCLAYQAHRATGRYQAEHGLFPTVLWVVPTPARAAALRGAIARDTRLDDDLFQVCLSSDYAGVVCGHQQPVTEPGGQEGGLPS